MTKPTIVMKKVVKHGTATLTPGAPDLAGSCYTVKPAVAALFEGMDWSEAALDAVDPVDMTYLDADPDTVRHIDGMIVVPAAMTGVAAD